MRNSILPLLICAAFTIFASAQNPVAPTNSTPAAPPVSAKDVRVIPFAREHEVTSLDGKRGFPDELRVVTTTNKVHLYGTKRVESVKADGRLITHGGKLALLAPADRVGKLQLH